MKNKVSIFIGCDFPERYAFYQINLVYEFFKQNGYTLVKTPIDSDIIILGGIPFNIFEEKKSLLTINYYLKKYPGKEIITIGYLSNMINLLDIGNIKVIGSTNFNKFNDLFEHIIPIENIKFTTIRNFLPLKIQEIDLTCFGYDIEIKSNYNYTESDLNITIEDIVKGNHDISKIEEYDFKYSYLEDKSGTIYLQTCSGCGANYSYCIINKVGFVKSRSLLGIINEITNALSNGKNIVYLMDQDTGSYGIDIGSNFAYLLNEINKIPGDFKINIKYIEPGKLEKFYDKIDKNLWKRIEKIEIPIQTTSQRILKLMNRKYNIEKIIDIVTEIRKYNKNIIITTQFIYGFPTETFEEFKDYFRMLKYFNYIDFILYSEKKGLALSKIKKNTIPEIYKKYMYYQKIHELFPEKIENSYFLNIKTLLILNYLYNKSRMYFLFRLYFLEDS